MFLAKALRTQREHQRPQRKTKDRRENHGVASRRKGIKPDFIKTMFLAKARRALRKPERREGKIKIAKKKKGSLREEKELSLIL